MDEMLVLAPHDLAAAWIMADDERRDSFRARVLELVHAGEYDAGVERARVWFSDALDEEYIDSDFASKAVDWVFARIDWVKVIEIVGGEPD